MSDGGKGSERRNEDAKKVRDNWDLIDWSKKSDDKKQQTEYFKLVEKYAQLSTYENEYAGPDDMEELTTDKEETANKLGFTVDQLDNI